MLWLGAAVVVVATAAFFVVQQGMIAVPTALSPVEWQTDRASEVVSTSVADNAPKVQATIDTGARGTAKTVGDVLWATRVPNAKPERYHTPTPELPGDKPDIDIRQLEDRTHRLINAERAKSGLSALEHIEQIRLIARSHSEDMANRNYFSHDTLEGLDSTDRGMNAGYDCRKDYGSYYSFGLAENIHQSWLSSSTTYWNGIAFHDWNTQGELATNAVEGWMNSKGHRENILDSSYDKSGVGVAIAEDGKVYFTQNFC
ncbi:MAG: CAP domain-containing protein [Chloroflexota bacterium]|nr:CAP domain-containing protein [Chloroflexota bacterium]